MAQKISVLIEDDLDGSEAAGTVRFGLDGAEYEIDLNAEHEQELRDGLSRYVAAARKAQAARPARRTRTATTTPDSSEAALIREWAKSQGIDVSDRGRIPADLAERYHRRHDVPAAAFKPAETPDAPTLAEGETVRPKSHRRTKEPVTA